MQDVFDSYLQNTNLDLPVNQQQQPQTQQQQQPSQPWPPSVDPSLANDVGQHPTLNAPNAFMEGSGF